MTPQQLLPWTEIVAEAHLGHAACDRVISTTYQGFACAINLLVVVAPLCRSAASANPNYGTRGTVNLFYRDCTTTACTRPGVCCFFGDETLKWSTIWCTVYIPFIVKFRWVSFRFYSFLRFLGVVLYIFTRQRKVLPCCDGYVGLKRSSYNILCVASIFYMSFYLLFGGGEDDACTSSWE